MQNGSRMKFDEGCADDPEGWCIAVGDMADYVVETQKGGRYITREETLEILKQAEDNGFVHQITNIDGKNKIFAICNGNVNVCYALRTSQLFNTPNMSRSAYIAKVDKSSCVACGKCVESCPAGAVKLGQKLCDKEGCEIRYPKHPLPGDMPWGEHMWTHNYRDVNRINCYDTGTAPCKILHVLPISQYRATCSWPERGVTMKPLLSSRRTIRFLRYVDMSGTEDVRMRVQRNYR